MAKGRKVIKNIPLNIPLTRTVVFALALDYWNIPGWLCGVVGVILFLHWVIVLYDIQTRETIDLFADKECDLEGNIVDGELNFYKKPSGFQEKMSAIMKDQEKQGRVI